MSNALQLILWQARLTQSFRPGDDAGVMNISHRRAAALASLLMLFSCVPVWGRKKARPASDRSNLNEIENPGALANFFKALSEANSGRRIEPVRVMHFGDSHVAADVLTA